MANNSLDAKIWKLGSDSATVSVTTTSGIAAHATSAIAASNLYPTRKFLSITNNGAKWAFIGVGRTPTSTDYDYALAPISGTIDTNYVQGGLVFFDSSVPQDQINVITANSTSTVSVVVGV